MVALITLWALPAHAGQGTALLKYVPDDVDLVVGFNVAKSRSTPLFRKSLEVLKAEAAEVWKTFASVQFDPAKDLDTVLVAGHLPDGKGDSTFVVVFEGRLGALGSVLAPSEAHSGLPVHLEQDVAALLIDKRLVFCSVSLLDDVVATVKGKRPSARTSRRAKVLRAGLAAMEPRVDLWLVLSGKVFKEQLPVQGKVEWVGMTAATSKGVAIELRAGVDSEPAAAEISTWFGNQLGTVKSLLAAQGFESMADSFEVKNTGATIGVSALMSEGEVARALTLVSRQATAEAGSKSP